MKKTNILILFATILLIVVLIAFLLHEYGYSSYVIMQQNYARKSLSKIQAAIISYHNDNGTLPPDLNTLVANGNISENLINIDFPRCSKLHKKIIIQIIYNPINPPQKVSDTIFLAAYCPQGNREYQSVIFWDNHTLDQQQNSSAIFIDKGKLEKIFQQEQKLISEK